MKVVLLFIAAVSAVQIHKQDPVIDAYNVKWQAEAAGQHSGTMGEANRRLGNQQAGVAESKADQCAYNLSHGNKVCAAQ